MRISASNPISIEFQDPVVIESEIFFAFTRFGLEVIPSIVLALNRFPSVFITSVYPTRLTDNRFLFLNYFLRDRDWLKRDIYS